MNTPLSYYTKEIYIRLAYVFLFFILTITLYWYTSQEWFDIHINLIYSHMTYKKVFLMSLHPTDWFFYLLYQCALKSVGWCIFFITIQIYMFSSSILYRKQQQIVFKYYYLIATIIYLLHIIQVEILIPYVLNFFFFFHNLQILLFHNLKCLSFEIQCYCLNYILIGIITYLYTITISRKFIHFFVWIVCAILTPPDPTLFLFYIICSSVCTELCNLYKYLRMSVLGLEPKTH